MVFVKMKDWGLRNRRDLRVKAIAGRTMMAFARLRNAMVFAFPPPPVVGRCCATVDGHPCPRPPVRSAQTVQRCGKVLLQVGHRLEPDGDADQSLADTGLQPLLRTEPTVRGARRMDDK